MSSVAARLWMLTLLVALAALPCEVPAAADTPETGELEQVTLQLKWYHQFQFAGYYAAQAQGYYRDEGLQVAIVEGTPDRAPLESVLAGEADFGVGDSSIILDYLRGAPVVVLAAIFQHSPYILMTRADRGLSTPLDLVGKKIMLSGSQGEGELLAMFLREGVDPSRLTVVPHTWNNSDLIDGRVDAISAYSTVEVIQLRQLGVEPHAIHARDYGVDFYGDVLFTTREEVDRHGDRVERFRRASLRGWEYAMNHTGEMIDWILRLPGVTERGIARKNLEFEAAEMKPLILSDIVEMGHMNPGRWERIAQTFVDLGVVKPNAELDDFVYDPDREPLRKWMSAIFVGLGVALLIALAIGVIDFNLRRMVQRRTRELREEIAMRERTEQALRASEMRNRALLSSIPDVIFRLDRSGNVIDFEASQSTIDELHLQTLRGAHVSARLGADGSAAVMQAIERALETGELIEFEFTVADQPGSEYEARIVPAGSDQVLAVVRDVTAQNQQNREKAAFDRQLQETQKLESLGVLAGGIAHDFNNLLTGVIGNASLAKSEKSLSPPVAHCLEEIEIAANRAAGLCRQMLAYAGKGNFVVRNVDLNEIVCEMTQLLRFSISKKAELNQDLTSEKLTIFADGSQIQQIVMNLVVNASEALPDQGGSIVIRTRRLRLDKESLEGAYLAPDLQPGTFASLEVQDTGCGMDEATLAKVFEPFFTTKFTGRGLGLAAVHGIVRAHHGALRVTSQRGEGTTFQLLLPIATGTPEAAPKPLANSGWRGEGPVLIVDDEEYVRQVTAKILSGLGFEPQSVAGGNEAIAMVAERPGHFRLVLLDLTMPHPDGMETYAELHRLAPNLPVILVSGYSNLELRERFSSEGLAGFLQKPFRRAELIATLQSALGESSAVSQASQLDR